MSVVRIPDLVRRLYAIVAELEKECPGRRFTLDGHLVGSVGEVLAAHHYGLELLAASTESHDARAPDGRLVQIKATQRNSVALRSTCHVLLVLRLDQKGGFEEIYNGPGEPVWQAAGRMQKNGQRPIVVTRLRTMNQQVERTCRLERSR